ncbi:DC-STAMP domain-containing protein 2-like [Phymastichus coffea]|uniref:DC-STAMP domain-containing protein 2-like n=1 Tax=Phymastichus coffea TaxID=108790 RepID=UPI00273B7716|nr:DC-STAMP domain-containing protein 2-like [Phymastichus coffea]
MAFFQLVVKARKLRQARRDYRDEKLRSIEISRGDKVRYTLGQRLRRRRILLRRKIRGLLGSCASCLENTWLHRQTAMLRADGTLENYVAKSVCGFVGGVALTYVFFVFFVFQLHFGLASATVVCSLVGVFMSLGLAFYPRVRCMVFLFLPQFFSKRGRQALMAYAFILALSGPAKNALYNIGVLSESLACSQEQLKEAVKSVIELMKQPFYALRDSLAQIVKSVKAIAQRIKKTLIAMKRLVISILQVIKSAFDWLASIVSICNKRLGTPYERCQNSLDEAVADCQDKLGDYLNKICDVTYLANTVCYTLKPLDLVCVLSDFVSDAIVGVVRRKLVKFSREMKAMLHVKIKFSHSFHFESNKSRSLAEVSRGISSEIKARTNRFLALFDWVGFVTSFLFLFLFLKVAYYRYKWLTSDRFDNRYILSHMREIDLRRVKQDKETIFPLNRRERGKYAPLTSLLLIEAERVRLAKSAVFLAVTSVKLLIYIATDYCLFWILDTVRYHGRVEATAPREPYGGSVEVRGTGFLADVYRSVVVAFSPYTDEHRRDAELTPCLPEPKPPDYDAYARIVAMTLFCWIMALFEPYGLRLRHVVLSQYYPDRAKQRAVWLYNHIMRSRGSFLKYARRQLRRSFGLSRGVERVTLRERLWAVCPLLNRLAPLPTRSACLVCGSPERDRHAPHVRCPTPGCAGVYCPQCFQDLGKLCTVCLSPLDYGDLTDMSEERDSSEDEPDLTGLREKLKRLRRDGAEAKKPDEEETLLPADTSDDDTRSEYSYGYQEEQEPDAAAPRRVKFKDLEAQAIRDDVTMQVSESAVDRWDSEKCFLRVAKVFDGPAEDASSSNEERVYCFGFVRLSQPKKPAASEDDSTSVADTETWTTDELQIGGDDDVLEIEIEQPSDDELPSRSFRREKPGRLKRLTKAVVALFRKKRSTTYKDSIQTGVECDEEPSSSSLSSSSSSECDEHRELLRGSKTDEFGLRKRNVTSTRRTKRQRQSRARMDKVVAAEPLSCETKELPRRLKSICNDTKYYEVDERESYYSPRERIQYRADYSTMTDTQSTVDSDPSRDRSSTYADDRDSYIYTSDNNENRYDTHFATSNSSLPDDFDFSEMSSDNSSKRIELRKASEAERLTKEDKIKGDSDEKGSKYEKILFHDAISSSEISDKKTRKGDFGAHLQSNKKTQTNVESDVLRRDKVDKETANARKRSCLMQEKLSDIDSEKARTKSDDLSDIQTDNGYRYRSLPLTRHVSFLECTFQFAIQTNGWIEAQMPAKPNSSWFSAGR